MSILYYKYKFKYDDNYGNLQETVIYQEVNNTTDTETFYNDKGNIIETNGSTSYIIKLGTILRGVPSNDIEMTTISYKDFNNIFNSKNWINFPPPVENENLI